MPVDQRPARSVAHHHRQAAARVRRVRPAIGDRGCGASIRPTAEAKRNSPSVGARARRGSGLATGSATRIVWNLLSNGVKFTQSGGSVRVSLQRINSHVEIVVTDSGVGIHGDFLPHVFDRFRQADGSTTRNYGGLGLGLAIVRHLVELHGGTARAESEGENRGRSLSCDCR